ncbi:MAG: glycosyltransferase family 8 protein [Candidatus Limnocylindria bacterium]
MRLDIACAAEGQAYVAHCAAMLHSLLESNRDHDVHVHFMHGADIGGDVQKALAGMIEREGGTVAFLHIGDDAVAGLPTKDFTRTATWYRIFLPELLADVDRVLYLDADLLVLDSLAPLWSVDLRNRWVGAVTNVLQDEHSHRPASLGLAGPRVYFNAGVLLMNLEEMRRDRCSHAVFEYGVVNADQLEWRDQDALNVVLGSRRVTLHPRWNCMNSFYSFPKTARIVGRLALRQALRHPAIRHFEGPGQNKPWHPDADSAARALYLRHARRTPWPP